MIAIIDYGLGNLGSVKNALDTLGIDSFISKSPVEIERANGLILPGVGAAGEGMKNLKAGELDRTIRDFSDSNKPILGICLGMQLLMSESEEGNVKCLDIIKGKVKKFKTNFKVPQIGWNTVNMISDCRLLKEIRNESYFYFVHSYFCSTDNSKTIKGNTQYGDIFCSVMQDANTYGVQFHPEKSGDNGLLLLKNFSEIVYEDNTGN